MYSPAAWPPCQAKIAPVKARPMLIHTADSMAASLVVGVRRPVDQQQVDDEQDRDQRQEGEPDPDGNVEAGEVLGYPTTRKLGRRGTRPHQATSPYHGESEASPRKDRGRLGGGQSTSRTPRAAALAA